MKKALIIIVIVVVALIGFWLIQEEATAPAAGRAGNRA
jgi:preprotein translocase subunit SecG